MSTDGSGTELAGSTKASITAADKIPTPQNTPSASEVFKVLEVNQKVISLWNPLFKQFVASQKTGRKVAPSAESLDGFFPHNHKWLTGYQVACLQKCEKTSKANLAVGMPASSGNALARWKSGKRSQNPQNRPEMAVDGLVGSHNYLKCTKQQGDDTWWEVKLSREAVVSTIRITGMDTIKAIDSLRTNPFVIEIDGQRCVNPDNIETGSWEIPKGQVTDCVCKEPLTGSTVRTCPPVEGLYTITAASLHSTAAVPCAVSTALPSNTQ